jgi:polyhydroxyalkanoate synthesis regulator phasin
LEENHPVSAEQTVPKPSTAEREGRKANLASFRESQRGRMAKTLENLLQLSRREAKRKDANPSARLKWVNTTCYTIQTYNSLLRDTEYDELREEVTSLREKVRKLSQDKH